MKRKVKVKCTLVQALRLCIGRTANRGSRGVALLFLDRGTRSGEGSASRPGRFLPPGRNRYPLYRRLGGPQGRSGQVRKISPPPRFDARTIQAVASRYTHYATRPTVLPCAFQNFNIYDIEWGFLYLYFYPQTIQHSPGTEALQYKKEHLRHVAEGRTYREGKDRTAKWLIATPP